MTAAKEKSGEKTTEVKTRTRKPTTEESDTKKTSVRKAVERKAVKKATEKPTKKGTNTTKKAAAESKKTTSKATKKTSEKKMTKKPAEKKTTKSDSQTKGEKKSKQTTKRTKKGGSKTELNKSEKFVAEALSALRTEDKEWVSDSKIIQYFVDYYETSMPQLLPRLVRSALQKLHQKKLLKNKKRSYAFNAEGLKKLLVSEIEKRTKIDRPVHKSEPEEEPEPEVKVTSTGRVSKGVVRN